jgi:hypothetical protein
MVVGGGVSASHDWSWIDLGIENVCTIRQL